MISNFFFKKKTVKIKDLFKNINSQNNFIINNITPLDRAVKNDLTFFDTIKYKTLAINTKASACITTNKLEKYLPEKTLKLIVNNVLFELALALKKMYPSADVDYPDFSLRKPSIKKKDSVKYGNNVLIGKNVKIGSNSLIGSNTIIEHDVKIGKNCVIGSNVIIKNSILGDRVVI
tara:strand:+ start:849 stop:1376 length:528 start_codon:yes stop_codon:yes gene_type:complete